MLQSILLGSVLVATSTGAVQPATEDPTYPKTLAEFRVYDKTREVVDVPFVQAILAPLLRLHAATLEERLFDLRSNETYFPKPDLNCGSIHLTWTIDQSQESPEDSETPTRLTFASTFLDVFRSLCALPRSARDPLLIWHLKSAFTGYKALLRELQDPAMPPPLCAECAGLEIPMAAQTEKELELIGLRHAILALVWAAGELEVHAAHDLVVEIATLGCCQRDALNVPDRYSFGRGYAGLHILGLYDRSLLGTALCRLGDPSAATVAPLLDRKLLRASFRESYPGVWHGFLPQAGYPPTVALERLDQVTDAEIDRLIGRQKAAAPVVAGTKNVKTNSDGAVVPERVVSYAQLRDKLTVQQVRLLKDRLSELPTTKIFLWKRRANTGDMNTAGRVPKPLTDQEEQYTAGAVLGSLRLRPVFELAVAIPRAELVSLVRSEVERLLPVYRDAFASKAFLQKADYNSKEVHKAMETGGAPGHVLGVGMVEQSKNADAVTLGGLRYALLLYAWLIGELELQEAQDALVSIVEEAAQQRIAITADEHLAETLKLELLEHVALYNRTLLGTALLRILKQDVERDVAVAWMGLTRKRWEMSPVTEKPAFQMVDGHPVFAAPTPAQRSMELYDNMTDAQFDALRAALD